MDGNGWNSHGHGSGHGWGNFYPTIDTGSVPQPQDHYSLMPASMNNNPSNTSQFENFYPSPFPTQPTSQHIQRNFGPSTDFQQQLTTYPQKSSFIPNQNQQSFQTGQNQVSNPQTFTSQQIYGSGPLHYQVVPSSERSLNWSFGGYNSANHGYTNTNVSNSYNPPVFSNTSYSNNGTDVFRQNMATSQISNAYSGNVQNTNNSYGLLQQNTMMFNPNTNQISTTSPLLLNHPQGTNPYQPSGNLRYDPTTVRNANPLVRSASSLPTFNNNPMSQIQVSTLVRQTRSVSVEPSFHSVATNQPLTNFSSMSQFATTIPQPLDSSIAVPNLTTPRTSQPNQPLLSPKGASQQDAMIPRTLQPSQPGLSARHSSQYSTTTSQHSQMNPAHSKVTKPHTFQPNQPNPSNSTTTITPQISQPNLVHSNNVTPHQSSQPITTPSSDQVKLAPPAPSTGHVKINILPRKARQSPKNMPLLNDIENSPLTGQLCGLQSLSAGDSPLVQPATPSPNLASSSDDSPIIKSSKQGTFTTPSPIKDLPKYSPLQTNFFHKIPSSTSSSPQLNVTYSNNIRIIRSTQFPKLILNKHNPVHHTPQNKLENLFSLKKSTPSSTKEVMLENTFEESEVNTDSLCFVVKQPQPTNVDDACIKTEPLSPNTQHYNSPSQSIEIPQENVFSPPLPINQGNKRSLKDSKGKSKKSRKDPSISEFNQTAPSTPNTNQPKIPLSSTFCTDGTPSPSNYTGFNTPVSSSNAPTLSDNNFKIPSVPITSQSSSRSSITPSPSNSIAPPALMDLMSPSYLNATVNTVNFLEPEISPESLNRNPKPPKANVRSTGTTSTEFVEEKINSELGLPFYNLYPWIDRSCVMMGPEEFTSSVVSLNLTDYKVVSFLSTVTPLNKKNRRFYGIAPIGSTDGSLVISKSGAFQKTLNANPGLQKSMKICQVCEGLIPLKSCWVTFTYLAKPSHNLAQRDLYQSSEQVSCYMHFFSPDVSPSGQNPYTTSTKKPKISKSKDKYVPYNF